MKFFDTHTHSEFSPDGRTTLVALVERAVELGVAGLAFTDHLDLLAPRGSSSQFNFSIAERECKIEALRRELAEQKIALKLFSGIEVGLQPISIKESQDFIKGAELDQVIASVHFIDGEDPYLGNYYEGKDFKEAFGRTLEIIYQTAVEFKDFDVIGHFDYVARYAHYSVRDIFYRDFPEQFDTLLKFLAQNGKALEINTKTYSWHGDHLQMLDVQILKRFRELGGEFITLGSDAHHSDRLCENFEFYAEIIKNCGFEGVTHYASRRPIVIKF